MGQGLAGETAYEPPIPSTRDILKAQRAKAKAIAERVCKRAQPLFAPRLAVLHEEPPAIGEGPTKSAYVVAEVPPKPFGWLAHLGFGGANVCQIRYDINGIEVGYVHLALREIVAKEVTR